MGEVAMTFLVPSTSKTLPEDYVERVKRMHESGGHGSRGYRYDWKQEEARKNVLRTHTTAVSVKMLRALAAKVPVFIIFSSFSYILTMPCFG